MDTEVGETTYENWFQREGNACKSMCMGFLLVILCSMGIFWNELDYVLKQATADVIAKATVVDGCTAQSANDNRLIFAACVVTAPDIAPQLPDVLQDFVPEFHGASLTWKTEILQWDRTSRQECTKDNSGGKTCTTYYDYSKKWFTSPHQSYGSHDNYGDIPVNVVSSDFTVPPYTVVLSGQRDVTANGFALDAALQSQIPENPVRFRATGGATQMWQQQGVLTPDMLTASGDYLITGSGDDIGDIRISVSGKSASVASICAKQMGGPGGDPTPLGAWPPEVFDMWGRETHPLEYLREGEYTKGAFQAEIKEENAVFANVLRVLLLAVMIGAFFFIFQPLSVAADLLRFLNYCTCCLGSILDNAAQTVICCVSCASGCWCFMVIFVIAWLRANPTYALVGIILIVGITVAGCVAGQTMGKKADARAPKIVCEYLKVGKDGRAPFLASV